MSALLARVYQQAVITFAENPGDLQRNLVVLKGLVDKIRFSDLHLDHRLVEKQYFSQPGKAPCTYVGIHEDSSFSMSVFIMGENYTMPMHDHPQMNGLLKCVAGKLRIQSYSMDTSRETPLDTLERLYALNPAERTPVKKYIHCKREQPIEVDESSEAAVLTPNQKNIHQITAIGGPVAFFDILSPPYDTHIDERPHLKRRCTFLREKVDGIEAADSVDSEAILEKIPQPLSYYCDNVQFQ